MRFWKRFKFLEAGNSIAINWEVFSPSFHSSDLTDRENRGSVASNKKFSLLLQLPHFGFSRSQSFSQDRRRTLGNLGCDFSNRRLMALSGFYLCSEVVSSCKSTRMAEPPLRALDHLSKGQIDVLVNHRLEQVKQKLEVRHEAHR